MKVESKIESIQRKIKEQGFDGWLLYDNFGSNRFIKELFEIPSQLVLTRRFFYWIPVKGEPIKILHRVEGEKLDFIPGEKILYLSWQQLEEVIKGVLKKVKKIAMEYSPRNANPYVSVVDGGTLEMIRELKVGVFSSADLLQPFTSVLDETQIKTHLEAASVLENTVSRVWDLIADNVRKNRQLSEYEVQKFILSEFTAQNCITDDKPICAVNEHSALPHYRTEKQGAKLIGRGDFILIDLWCKLNLERSVYADISRVAVLAPEPTPRQQEVFELVREAQKKGTDFIRSKMEGGKPLQGSAVDDVCRGYITEHGFGEYFTHRTGHNIGTQVYGCGANLDNLETADSRKILPGTCFSIAPGIYLPEEFGIRIEHNILISSNGFVRVTGGVEDSIVSLL